MKTTRREFLSTTAAASAGMMFAGAMGQHTSTVQAGLSSANAPSYKTRIYKSLIASTPSDEICETWKKAGIEGMEVQKWDIPLAEARAARQIAEKHDFHIHSVMRGWAEFNHKDESVAEKTVEQTIHSIRVAAAYGAETVLLVPCRVGGMKMPAAWDFEIDFDPKTLLVKTVAAGDNSEYAEYIKAQNDSTIATIKAVEKLIPVAAKEGVIVAIENVWNNLWCTPELAAGLVRYFDNPWIKAYFDLGNHTKYSDAEYWIEAFGSDLIKLHIKGYKITKKLGKYGGGEGDWCAIDKASIDWKGIRNLLERNNYNGWVSVEEGHYPPEGYAKILDDFIAGKQMGE